MNDPLSIYPNCGTPAGYYKHRRYNTITCRSCTDAHNARQNEYRQITAKNRTAKNKSVLLVPASKTAKMSVETFYEFFYQLSPQSQGRMMRDIGPDLVNRYLQSALDIKWNNKEIQRRQKEKEQ